MPVPGDVSAAFYSLAEALEVMRREGGDVNVGTATAPEGSGNGDGDGGEGHDDLVSQMIQTLLREADTPPKEVEGVSEEFCDGASWTRWSPAVLQFRSPQYYLFLQKANSVYICTVLDRVSRKTLTETQVCPICNNPFLEDQYPLVVQLPCHPTHMFDLECIRPWLRLRGTCPLDRTDFGKQEREKEVARRQKPVVDDDEEEWDGMYG